MQSHSGHSTQWTQYAVDAVHSGIVLYVGWDIVFLQKGQTSGCSTQWMPWNSDIWWWGHYPLCHCINYILWFDLLCTKDNVPPPYTNIPLRTAYCIYCVLRLLRTAFTVYCVHCMPYMAYIGNLFALTKCSCHLPTLLVTHETITNQKLFISNQYLMSPPPTKKVPKSCTFLAAWLI